MKPALTFLCCALFAAVPAFSLAGGTEAGFAYKSDLIASGLPLSNASEIAFHGGTLYISDFGADPNSLDGMVLTYAIDDGTTSILVDGAPLATPRVSIVGPVQPMGEDYLVVSDLNSDVTTGCCEGRVFLIEPETGETSVWGGLPPEPSGVANPIDADFSPGGNFPARGLLVGDIYRDGDNTFFRVYHISEGATKQVLFDERSSGSIEPSAPPLWRSVAAGPGGEYGTGLYIGHHSLPRVYVVEPSAQPVLFSQDPRLFNIIDLEFAPGNHPAFPAGLYAMTTSRSSGSQTVGIYAISAAGEVTEIISGLPSNDSLTGLDFGGFAFTEAGDTVYLAYGSLLIKVEGQPLQSGSWTVY